MTVIWVAEDIGKDGSFRQTKGELLCTVSNLAFIKHYYPNFHTILFVDKFTKSYYDSFGITQLFDEVNDTLLDKDIDIDKEIFWAAGKLIAQRETKGPTLMMDLDFWLFSDISKFGVFESDVACLWAEEISGDFYHTPEEALKNSDLSLTYNWDNYGLNVSFLYLSDDEFKNRYCNLAIDYMKSMYGKISKNLSFIERTKYILFAEQYLLNQLIKDDNKGVKVLIDDYYNIQGINHIHSIGINLDNCPNYFYHMGNHKDHFKINDDFAKNAIEWFYEKTISTIVDEKFLNIFNKIYNTL